MATPEGPTPDSIYPMGKREVNTFKHENTEKLAKSLQNGFRLDESSFKNSNISFKLTLAFCRREFQQFGSWGLDFPKLMAVWRSCKRDGN